MAILVQVSRAPLHGVRGCAAGLPASEKPAQFETLAITELGDSITSNGMFRSKVVDFRSPVKLAVNWTVEVCNIHVCVHIVGLPGTLA